MSHSKGDRQRVTLRINDYLRVRIQHAADKAGCDVNTWINRVLLAQVKKQENGS